MKKTILALFMLFVLSCFVAYADVPVANAGPDQTVLEDYLVTLDGSLSTGALKYNWTQTGGPSVELSDPTVVKPTFTPDDPGDYVFQLVVNNGTDDSVADTVSVTVKQVMRIKDLDVKVGSETDKNIQDEPDGYRIRQEAKPEDTVKFDIEVESLLDDDISEEDMDLEDVFITITIYDIDDGEELEEESDEFDIKPGKDESESLEFEVPLKVDEGDYDVLIRIEGEDEKGVEHVIEKELLLEVEKDKHYIKIYRLNLNPTTVKCTRTATLNTEIMNLGRDDEEDVTLEIMSFELGINSVSSPDYDLSYDWDDDENVFAKTLTITLPDDFKAGTYPIVAKTYYDEKLSETKTVELVVEECKPVVEEPEEEEEIIDIEDIEIPEDVEIAEPIEEEQLPFTSSSQFYTLLVIVIILVIGLIIFLVGAFVIKASKKK